MNCDALANQRKYKILLLLKVGLYIDPIGLLRWRIVDDQYNRQPLFQPVFQIGARDWYGYRLSVIQYRKVVGRLELDFDGLVLVLANLRICEEQQVDAIIVFHSLYRVSTQQRKSFYMVGAEIRDNVRPCPSLPHVAVVSRHLHPFYYDSSYNDLDAHTDWIFWQSGQ